METTYKIYGASDDLIELDKNGKGHEEYGGGDKPKYLHFQDGTVVKVVYSPKGYDCKWKVEFVTEGPAIISSAHVPAQNEDDDCSDGLTIVFRGDVPEPQCTRSGKGIQADEIREKLENLDWRDVSDEQLLTIWPTLRKSCPS